TERTFPRRFELTQPFIAVKVLRQVVNPHEVDSICAHALEAVFDRPPGAVGGVVVDDFVRPSMLEQSCLLAEVAGAGLNLVENDSAQIRAEHVLIAFVTGQRLTEANFRQSRAVERRRIEVTRPLLPGSVHSGRSLFLGDVAEHVSERRSPEAERSIRKILSDTHGASTAEQLKSTASRFRAAVRGNPNIRVTSRHKDQLSGNPVAISISKRP